MRRKVNFMHRFILVVCMLVSTVSFSYSQASVPEVREYAKSAPYFISRSPQKLTEYLTKNETSDAQKAMNIYTWIIHNISYDLKRLENAKQSRQSVQQTLRRRKGICNQYTELFVALCLNAHIPAKEIQGYSRGFTYLEDDTFYETDHAWSAVKLDSSWFLVDATWGSGAIIQQKRPLKELWFKWFNRPYINDKYKFVPHPNHDFFLIQAEKLIVDHLPADPTWQLVEYPISVKTFEDQQWLGYQHRLDTSYNKMISMAEYSRLLQPYEFYFGNQYLTQTAEQANEYNPKNYALLSAAAYNNAGALHAAPGDPETSIQLNKDAIKQYQLAIANARKHQSIVNVEVSRRINSIKSRIKHELQHPSTTRQRHTQLQLKRSSQQLSNEEKLIDEQAKQIAKLQQTIEKRGASKLKFINDPARVPTKKINQHKQAMEAAKDSILSCKDSIQTLQGNLQTLFERKEIMQSTLLQLNSLLNVSIISCSSSIKDYQQLTKLNKLMQHVDSIGKMVDSLHTELQQVEQSISHHKRAVQPFYTAILTLAQQNKSLVFNICSLSKGEECDSIAYMEYEDLIKQTYTDKLALQEKFLSISMKDFDFHRQTAAILLKQNKLLETNSRLLSLYHKNMVDRIEFKKRKSMYITDLLISNSNEAIQNLTLRNNKLQGRIIENKRKNTASKNVNSNAKAVL